MSAPTIHFPSEAEGKAAFESFALAQRQMRAEHRTAANAAVPALRRLVEAMLVKTGQGYKIRGLLLSLWNGANRADLSDTLCLDWSLKRDFCAVLLGFGFGGGAGLPEFFYDALKEEVQRAGLWVWFLEPTEAGGDK